MYTNKHLDIPMIS